MADPSRTGGPRFYSRPANLSVQSSLRNPFCETYRLVRSPGPRWSTSASRVAKPVFSARVAAWILPPPTRWKPSRILPTISISALPGPSRTAKSAPPVSAKSVNTGCGDLSLFSKTLSASHGSICVLSTARKTTLRLPLRPRVSKFHSRAIGFRICRKPNGRCLNFERSPKIARTH